jgi:hypothetical protein
LVVMPTSEFVCKVACIGIMSELAYEGEVANMYDRSARLQMQSTQSALKMADSKAELYIR